MRIAIDVRALTEPRTGIGYYLTHLLNEFADLHDENTYYLCSSGNFLYVPPKNPSRFVSITQKGLPGNLWVQTQLPFLLKKLKIDVFHSPFGVLPLGYKGATVITLHDLGFNFYPNILEFKNRILLPWITPISIKRANRIIVDSFSTKKDLQKVYKLSEERISLIHLASGTMYSPIPKDIAKEKLQDKYHLTQPFILCVATLEPRKNIIQLIKAYHQLSPELRNQYQLILVGKKGWQYQELFTLVKQLKLKERILFTGYIPEEDLPYFYNAATVFVYPSLYEGFGLPVLDAMACGIPVITSNTSSFPEIVGDAGILVDPHDSSSLSDAIQTLLTNPDKHKLFSEKALERSKIFSWKTTAKNTHDIYLSLK